MRTKFFFFAMLVSIAASATVTVTPISTDYSAKKVTFKVAWTNSPTAPYNNRVWIWIDFCPINGVIPQSFSTATISNPTKSGNGTITGLNGRGFFIEYGSTNAGTTVTATLSNAPAGQFNWCVYGSDYPPNVTLDKGTYTFKGTTNFIVSNPSQTLTTKTIVKSSLTVNSSTTFTDATGYPGIGSLYCPYTGSDLYMDATYLCQQRTSGARNWEAWIKDTRDNELYRIVLMPDTKWWLAQNVKIASCGSITVGTNNSKCTKDECGRLYSGAHMSTSCGGSSGTGSGKQGICPNGWTLPVVADYNTFVQAISSTQSVICARLQSLDNPCSGGNNYYGWASEKNSGTFQYHEEWRSNDATYCSYALSLNDIFNQQQYCGRSYVYCTSYADRNSTVRCFRQL